MSKFKQIPQTFILQKTLEFFKNMVKNYSEDCHDDDFFAIIRNCLDHGSAVELIETAYTAKELQNLQSVKSRCNRLDFGDTLDDICQALWNYEPLRGKCKTVLESMRSYILAEECRKRGNDIVEARFRKIKQTLKLSDLEAEILLLAYIRDNTCFCWPRRVDDREKPMFFAMALDRSYAEVEQAVSPRSRLMKFGLLDQDFDFNRRALGGYMDGVSDEAIERRFYKKVDDKEVLPWSFYGDLAAKDGEIIKRMVAASAGKCNILLYGAPGTGKSSFALSLAKELGRTPFEVRQGDDDGRNMKSEARMMGIQVCNEQEDPKESLMVVDEADELLRGSSCGFGLFGLFGSDTGGKSTEKGVMNSILDEMRVPAVWISNAPAEVMDESVRRRFDYSICFERMNGTQRISIWRNVVDKLGLGELVPESRIEQYATTYETSAGGISTVLENVKRMNPAPDKVEELIATLMKPHCKLMGVKEGNRFLPAKDYSLEGLNINGKVKLDRLVAAVRNYLDASFNAAGADRPRMNVLLYGPPGTGKTEFVKYLGKTLDRKVLVVKSSDILGMYVGESEKNIARAFRQAEAERAILFFDEVDGLLQSRANASHSWEVTQVNELLQQMENFDGVMIAATNFSKNLDPATMRRFTFKLEFGYLDGAGKRSFFERMFNTRLTEDEAAELDELRNLAPGDFRTVRQEQFYLADEQTNLDRIAALKEECAVKKDESAAAPIGFAA